MMAQRMKGSGKGEDMSIKIALAGNPNCGKTTLFNNLTGSNQYVGNWPGVTVEKKEGRLVGNKDVIIQDLPGIYSLSPYTLEEVVTRNYLVQEKPDVILNIIDGTNIERNLYLTTQLVEVGLPMVIAINMMDLVRKNGDKIDIAMLEKKLGCKVIEISALKGDATKKAAELCIEEAKKGKQTELPHVFTGSVEHAIAHIEESIQGLVDAVELRWYAIKVFERDSKALEHIQLSADLKSHLEEHIKECEKEMDDDAESIITNQRYLYIQDLVKECVSKKRKAGELSTSDKIDKIVTNRILALPIFAVVMFLVYYIAVSTIGTVVTDWTNDVLFGEWLQGGAETLLVGAGASDWVISLVVDGILGGLGAPIGFVPQMAIVFLFLSILEDCGYMARVAFIMDRVFRRFGLSGKSFIPFLISSGCGVPGIMGTRTIESESDRRMTMMTTTMIPCGAKLPVIALIAGFLMGGAWWMAPVMYFAGIIMVIVCCIILKKTKMFAGDPVPFVMELPAYHVPSVKGVLLHVWERVWAKEGIVSTMGLLSSLAVEVEEYEVSMHDAFAAFFPSGIAAVSFLLFNMFDSPCLAAISSMAKEMGNRKFFWFAILFQNLMAYCVALVVYQLVGLAIGEVAFNVFTVVALAVLAVLLYLLFRPDPNKKKVSEGKAAKAGV